MEKLEKQKEQFVQALSTLDEAYQVYTTSDFEPHDMLRDSVIQRFEYCIDLSWKLLKSLLEQKHAILVASPRTVYTESFKNKLINEEQIWLDMIETRNMLSHMYREENTERLLEQFAQFSAALHELASS